MLAIAFGKRYERLLFFTAPVSIATIIVLLVAVASTHQKTKLEATCLATAATAIAADGPKLSSEWKKAQPVTKDKYWGISYKLQLDLLWIHADKTSECSRAIQKKLDANYRLSHDELVSQFRKEAKQLLQEPLEMYGIILPTNTTLDLFGTKIQFELLTLTRILQVVLLPVLLMWLGSLYSTRYREAILIANAKTQADVFPHIINMFPSGHIPSPRKRGALVAHTKAIACVIYSLIRVALLAVFVVPPVAAYLASLYFMAGEDYVFLLIITGIVVFVFGVTTLIAELALPHSTKVFPPAFEEQSV